ncbi:MAG TPA: hypothetical protein VKZ58_03665 [Longimicrobiales bacterium]|nr:hypothetical protein [Longimicrobiales bacterium]
MHPELEILLQLQDLKAQRRELEEDHAERQVEVQEFNIDVARAIEELDRKIQEMEEQLSPAIRSRYRRISEGRGRAVVPVINGICYGCFESIPTAVAGDIRQNATLRHCEHCGRFLYILPG